MVKGHLIRGTVQQFIRFSGWGKSGRHRAAPNRMHGKSNNSNRSSGSIRTNSREVVGVVHLAHLKECVTERKLN
jgi:hypothetical protein